MKIPLMALCCITTLIAFSQQSGRMETDRPDQTESPSIVKHRYIQAELGFNMERNGSLTTLVLPTVLWKYGLSKDVELRLITQLNSEELQRSPTAGKSSATGLLPVEFGGKLSLWEERGLLPKTSVIAQVGIPTFASAYYRVSKYTPGFRFTMQHTLSERVGIGYNLGVEWSDEVHTPFWIYTFGPGYNVGKRGYAYIELFGEFHQYLAPHHNLDAGFAYYISDNAKLDISSGFNLENTNAFYIALGFSLRFKAF